MENRGGAVEKARLNKKCELEKLQRKIAVHSRGTFSTRTQLLFALYFPIDVLYAYPLLGSILSAQHFDPISEPVSAFEF